MSREILRIATRSSPLAIWQAEYVQQRLESLHQGLSVELVRIKTQGDKILDTPLAKIGGKGLFVKELEEAMMDGRADIAVHSMKDVPMELPEGFVLPVICEREDPRDAFVSNTYDSLMALPQEPVWALPAAPAGPGGNRPDLVVKSLRGNVQTRLGKLDAGEFDAIILAAAGLKRLEMHDRIRYEMPPEESLPAVGQGAVGIECREGDDRTVELLSPLSDVDTWDRVVAERAMNRRLEGGCQVPIAGFALLEGDELWMRALVAEEDGSRVLRAEGRAHRADGTELGVRLAEELLGQGADAILKALYDRQ